MIALWCQYEEEVQAARAALDDGTLERLFGRVSIWLGHTYRGGTPGTERGPEHQDAVGRHRVRAPHVAAAGG